MMDEAGRTGYRLSTTNTETDATVIFGEGRNFMVDGYITCVVLSAGESKRMGKPKLQLPLGKSTILEQTIDNFLNSKVNEVIVVVGDRADEIASLIAKRPVKVAVNPVYRQGMSTSISAGLSLTSNKARAIMLALADQPFIDTQTINHLIEAFSTHNKGIAIPVYQGRRGHPVIFAIKYKEELSGLKGDIGGRQIIDLHPDDILEVAVNCEGINLDIDTYEDYKRCLLSTLIVLIKGGGEVASGIAHELHCLHFRVCLTEKDEPLAVSRGTTFSEAVFDGIKTIEGVTAELVPASPEDVRRVWKRGNIPIARDPHTSLKEQLKPHVLVDATMAKKNTGTHITDAPLVIGMGSGFYAGRDAHIVVETNHSNNLGRLILEGEAEKDTGTPVAIGGLTKERVIWASRGGIFTSDHEIGDTVVAGETVGCVGKLSLKAPISGILRGLIRSGVRVSKSDKLVEIDQVNDSNACYIIRDKMRAIAGGVLEAIMLTFNQSI